MTFLERCRDRAASRRSADRCPIAERRGEPRHATGDPVRVRILRSGTPSLPATMTSVSRTGLGLILGFPLEPNERIEITVSPRLVILGDVRYCRQSHSDFRIGVHIESVEDHEPNDGVGSDSPSNLDLAG